MKIIPHMATLGALAVIGGLAVGAPAHAASPAPWTVYGDLNHSLPPQLAPAPATLGHALGTDLGVNAPVSPPYANQAYDVMAGQMNDGRTMPLGVATQTPG